MLQLDRYKLTRLTSDTATDEALMLLLLLLMMMMYDSVHNVM